LPCSTFLLQALEVLPGQALEVVPRLEQVRPFPCSPPLC